MCFARVRGKSGIRSWRLARGHRRMRVERKLTEEERRELAIVSLAYELQDEYCDDPIEGNELLDEYYRMAKEDLYGKEGRNGAR